MANGVSWIKLSIDIFNNKKIKQIRKLPEGDALIGIWLQILCLAGSINDNGMVYFTTDLPYSDEMLATEFDRPLMLTRLALKTFVTYGMIEIVNDVMLVSNWEKYQNVEGLEKIRESNRNRQKRFRENQLAQSENLLENKEDVTLHNVSKTLHDNVTVTPSSLSPSLSPSPILNSKVPSTKGKSFSPPSLEEVSSYCQERGNNIDAETFCDFYQSKDWVIGKDKMKNWQAAVRTWEKRERSKPTYQNKPTPNFLKPTPDYSQGESSFEQWAREDREKAEREKKAAK